MERRLVKVALIIIVLILVGIAFVFINAFFGNPLSASIASSRIQEYVQQHYPGEDFIVPGARYYFKNSSYVSMVQSRASRDTNFAVSWSGGSIHDSYESEVASKFTTYRRLQSEFDSILEDIINAEYSYPNSGVLGDLARSDGDFSALELDMPLDIHNPPSATSLVIWTSSKELSYELLAIQLLELHRLMQRRNIPIDYYTVYMAKEVRADEKPSEMLYAIDFPAEGVLEDNLPELIQEHQGEIDRRDNHRK